MKNFILFIVVGYLFIGCTQKTQNEAESSIDETGFTSSRLSSQLTLRWRINNNTQLEAALIGDPQGNGWIAIGFGKSMMAGAKIIVAQHATDSSKISDATGYNYGLTTNSTTFIDSSNISVSGTTITASFNVNISDVNITLNQTTPVIWAYRTTDQSKQDNLGAIGKHSARGSSSITFK